MWLRVPYANLILAVAEASDRMQHKQDTWRFVWSNGRTEKRSEYSLASNRNGSRLACEGIEV